MSYFITFEGIEGCGKTTQLNLLAEKLRQQGFDVLTTREPGGCPIADAIRQILLDPANNAIVPLTELLLYAAARAQHMEEVILPALRKNKAVLCDRFSDATTVYQGYGRGLELSVIAELNNLATGGMSPHLTLLLDMPVEDGLNRALKRNANMSLEKENRFEEESLDFHRSVRNGYLDLAHKQPERFIKIDALGTPQEVADRIEKAIDAFLNRPNML